MEKFLFFRNSVSDAVTIPVNRLISMEADNNSDAVEFHFEDLVDGLGQENIFTVDVTVDKAREVMSEVSDEINNGSKALIIIGDDVTNKYVSNYITNVNALTDI